MQKDRTDVRASVTAKIIAMLQTAQAKGGEFPWCRPGIAHARPTNVVSQQRYRGINHITLWATAHAANYQSGVWATYQQWRQIGAQVRKGETASPIVFYKPLEVAETDDAAADAETGSKTVRLVKGYHVFNADQTSGYDLPELPTVDITQRIDRVDRFVAHVGVSITHGGARAFYRPMDDTITMPERALFRDTPLSSATDGYHSVLLHEVGHASGHSKRLGRDLSGRFRSESYAMEECVAEWIAAMLCAELAITAQPRPDHAHYIGTWLSVMRNDPGAALTAAAKASQACDYLWAQQPT